MIYAESDNWRLHKGDCLKELDDSSYNGIVSLVAFDPPFGTGKSFSGPNGGYIDKLSDFDAYVTWLTSVVSRCREMLRPNGQLLIQLDYRFIHEAKVLCLDRVFGRDHFMGEIVVYSGLGATRKDRWTNKHSTILHYVRDPKDFYFNHEAVRCEPRSAKKEGYEEDKKLCSVQSWTMSTSDKRRTGFPTQKHPDLYQQLVEVHTRPGDLVLDPTAGSGTTGDAAVAAGRMALLCELNEDTCAMIKNRMEMRDAASGKQR